MYVNLLKTMKRLERKLDNTGMSDLQKLHQAYDLSVQLRSQLLAVIFEEENYGLGSWEYVRLRDKLVDGEHKNGMVTLTIREPLPLMKELTSDMQNHWLDLIHTAIEKIARETTIPRFTKAFVCIEIVTPKRTDNRKVWDTSNRAINLVINNLKGIFFKDDDFEHMAFAVTGRWGDSGTTIIRIISFDKYNQFFSGHGQQIL